MTALIPLLASTTTTTVAAASKSKSSPYGLLILVGLLAVFYLLVIRPRQQRTRQARQQAANMEIGDRVMSVGGIKGTLIAEREDGDMEVEVAPGVVLTFVRRAINVVPGGKADHEGEAETGVFDDNDDAPEDGEAAAGDGTGNP